MRARIVLFALAAALAVHPLSAQPPRATYVAKPAAWTSTLATWTGPSVTDVDFATWVKNAQLNNGMLMVPRFSFLAGFHQCFGGGFLTELDRQGVKKYGANSAGRYYETVSYDDTNKRSYFTYAWGWRAINPLNSTDRQITDDAFALIQDGLPAIPDNDNIAFENAQYLSDPANNPPPEKLAAAANKYAILWVGEPDAKDLADLNQMYDVLRNSYGFARADILILYGPGGPFAGQPWTPADKPATAADLQWAFTNWLQGKLAGLMPNAAAQVVFWAGGHGGARWPFLMSVDRCSVGLPGSAVSMLRGAMPESVVYEAGNGNNSGLWRILAGDIRDFAFSETSVRDNFQTKAGGWVYFSVDRASVGAPGTDVNREIQLGRSAGSDVFVLAQNGNRRLFDGHNDSGLAEKQDNADDELDALSLRNSANALDLATGLPSLPFFYLVAGSPNVWVYDPGPPGVVGVTYLYYDFSTVVDAAGAVVPRPREVDALALWDDGVRVGGRLTFDPTKDTLLFSTGRQEIAAPWSPQKACEIEKFGPNALGVPVLGVWRTCAQLGLVPGSDNVDALELGLGRNGEPIPYPSSSWSPSMRPPSSWPMSLPPGDGMMPGEPKPPMGPTGP